MKKYLLILLCVPLLLTGCKQIPKLDNGQEAVVELNDKKFSVNELYDELKKTYGTSALISMVDNYIVSKEINAELEETAKKNAQAEYDSYYAYYSKEWDKFLSYYGHKSNEEFLQSLLNTHKQDIVIKKYLKSDVIKDKEIEEYYKKNIFGEITARHILIIPDTKEGMSDDDKKKAKEDALKTAKEIIEQIKNSDSSKLEETITNLAKEKSEDTGSASQGGLIENFTNNSGLVKEFWDASLKLEVGKYSLEPVETEFGYHIIYKISQKDKPALDTVKDTVITKVSEELLADENSKFVYWSGLREKYNLKIVDTVIDDSYKATLKNMDKK